jgi:hypothetical protein
MPTVLTESKPEAQHIDGHQADDKNGHRPDIRGDQELLADAFQGENREHEMGMWEAFKEYPMACLWAFTMSFTIVSHDYRESLPDTRPGDARSQLTYIFTGHGVI